MIPKQHFTQPPPRYNQATLIRALEEKGIGRPSTYATILSTLADRDYVRMERRQMHPTDVGRMVSDLLVKNFPDLMDVGFTAEMENRLDSIEEGKENWTQTLEEFYSPFEKALEKAEKTLNEPEPIGRKCPECGGDLSKRPSRFGMFIGCSNYPKCRYTEPANGGKPAETPPEEGEGKPRQNETLDRKCPKCGGELVKKPGRYGMFIGCSKYPECRHTEPLEKGEPAPVIETEHRCEKCGAPMVIKRGRLGPFLSCSRYPECKNAKPLPTGVRCPGEGCDGEIITRRSKKGRPFYGCSNYPECDFVSSSRPYPKSCPVCDSPYLVAQRQELRCPAKTCSHQEPLPENWEFAGAMAASAVSGGESPPERA